MNVLLASAFVLGAAGSAHCIGMCGPIALAVPVDRPGWRARLLNTILLNSGRLTTYALLGVAFGAFGHGLRVAGLQQLVSIIAGAVLLLTVILPGLVARWGPGSRTLLFIGTLRGTLARHLRRTAPEALFLTGALNGLLPCGLLYSALLGASVQGSWQLGLLFMVLFGLGTWPAMIALRMSAGAIGANVRARLRKASPVFVSALAVLLILRGLQLGIPMLSPGPAPDQAHAAACH